MAKGILLAGGAADPNLQALQRAARARNIPATALLVGEDRNPAVHWELDTDTLFVNGVAVDPSGCFLRRDVFHGGGEGAEHRALAWYTTLAGWPSCRKRSPDLTCGSAG